MTSEATVSRRTAVCFTVLLMSAPAAAQEQGVIGNTVVIVNRFAESYLSFLPDGTYRHTAAMGVAALGRWYRNGDAICVQQTDPPPPESAPTFCVSWSERKIGDRWEADDPRNGRISYRLIGGVVDFPVGAR